MELSIRRASGSLLASPALAVPLLLACSPSAAGDAGSPATAAPRPTAAAPAPAPTTSAPPTTTPAGETSLPGTPTSQVLGARATATGQPAMPPAALACTPGAAATPGQTEGPYYRANPPQRASLLEPGMAGTRLTLTGYVVAADCQPVPGARVDFWQTDDQGQYDNSGYRLRGYQLTDQDGRYTLETIVPGLYPGRTRHIHVKVQARNQPVLTTQLYFAGEPRNSTDTIFDSRLAMNLQDAPGGRTAAFNFLIAATR